MSNNSVEWLFQKLWDTPKDKLNWYAIAAQAKAMHKEEIKSAFDVGGDSYYDLNVPSNSEQYYNETFGGNNEL
jgi:hypothetical protein